VALHPWFGTGGGTYIAHDLTKVFDNQYLTSAICLGLVGVVMLGLYLLVPVVVALYARTHTRDRGLRDLLAALAGAALAGTACSATFDSFSFAVFVFVDALVLGLVGACWRLVRAELDVPAPAPRTATLHPVQNG
jgi:O-antigen ligase